jgi:hypothetical protein
MTLVWFRPALTPVLHSQEIPKAVAESEQPGVRTPGQLPKHPAHRPKDGEPLVHFPDSVDPHADQENDEISMTPAMRC